MIKKLALLIIVLLVASPVFAVDTVVWTIGAQGENWVRLDCDITADSSGNVAAPTVTSTAITSSFFDVGKLIVAAGFKPDAGDTAPDALYDITMLEALTSADLLGGLGGNLSQTVGTIDFPVTAANGGPQYLFALPTLAGSGYGADNGSTCYLWLQNIGVTTVK